MDAEADNNHMKACDDDGHPRRTGNLWSAVAHIITSVIGSGVLSLAWSNSQLGWIGGPISLLFFGIVIYLSSCLLSDCYRDSATGKRSYSYMEAVRFNLGKKQTWACLLLQNLILSGTGIAYILTTSISMRAIFRSNCYHRNGHNAPCNYGAGKFMLVFGFLQMVVSQIPDFHNMMWLSVIAAIMSFAYSSVGLGLGLAKVIEQGHIKGSITGVATENTAAKVWLVFQALGDIAFAYPYSVVLLDIQDTLKSPPAENKTMKKASGVATLITTFFYLCCGCFGYAAFGSETPGNLLTDFGFYEPFWLVDFANACIVLHLVGGYQVFSQPVFALVEKWFNKKYSDNKFVSKFYSVELPYLPAFRMNLMRICFRSIYVALTTGVAMVFPYFNEVLGLLGALAFWPLSIYFPVEMYIVQKKVEAWSRKWVVLRVFSFVCLLVTLVCLVGSVQGLVSARFG